MNANQKKHLAAYTEAEALIDREVAASSGFPQIISRLHALTSAGLFRSDKVAKMGPGERYGYTTVQQPHMGMMRPVRVDACSELHCTFLQHIIAGHIHENLDAVFEIGCGPGLDLVSLAARFPKLPFYGGEIAPAGLRCARKLAAAAGLHNVTPVTFDLLAPDFSPVTGKDVLIYSHFVLVYANPFPRTFFPALLEAVKSAHLVLFEPVSFALTAQMTEPPLFDRNRARAYGIAEDLWEVIDELRGSGRIAIEEVVPDISGRSAFNAVTLLRFRKVA